MKGLFILGGLAAAFLIGAAASKVPGSGVPLYRDPETGAFVTLH